jgi:hypothetical protein
MKKPILLLALTTLIISCNTTEPPNGEKPTLTLKLEDASCTEVWITLSATNLTAEGGQATLILKQNDEVRDTINLSSADTLLYIDSLLPNTNYQYQVSSNEHQATSNELSVTTLDTTSHNFTFETFTFGGTAGSSILYDVAIINENNIWAVGEIYVADTSINGYTTYNAVHWDGVEWELKRILYDGNFWVIRTIFAFNENDIWFSAFVRFDGENFIELPIPGILMGWSPNKIWGSSSNDLYVVGNEGNIAHYQNGHWGRIESGTDVDLKDIYGTPDGKTIWISGYEDFKPTVLLKHSNSVVEKVFNTRDYLFVFDPEHLSGGIEGVWTNSNNFVYVTTWYSLYRKSIYLDPSKEEALKAGSPLIAFGSKSRGTDINDIYTIGFRNTIHHYNGVNFKTFKEPADDNVTYYSLDVKGNLSVLCGQKFENGISDKAIITLIK